MTTLDKYNAVHSGACEYQEIDEIGILWRGEASNKLTHRIKKEPDGYYETNHLYIQIHENIIAEISNFEQLLDIINEYKKPW